MTETPGNRVEIIRNALETHRISVDVPWKPSRCAGCTWIGWHHDQHVAEAVDSALREDTP